MRLRSYFKHFFSNKKQIPIVDIKTYKAKMYNIVEFDNKSSND